MRKTLLLAILLTVLTGGHFSRAATFSNAWLTATDPNRTLTVDNSKIFTVSFWFRLAIPSSVEFNENSHNLTILMDREDGDESGRYSYLFRYNVFNGKVEFVCNGGTPFVKSLIQRPYMARWYHVAVVREGNKITAYVDGRALPNDPQVELGDTAGAGILIGGSPVSERRAFYGDIIEVAFYRGLLDTSVIRDRMFRDQSANDNILGYFKLGALANSTTNAARSLYWFSGNVTLWPWS